MWALIALVLVIALALPAQATASFQRFTGGFDPFGDLGLRLKKKHGKTKMAYFFFQYVPITCDSGAESISNELYSATKVRHKKFHVNAHTQNREAEIHIEGTLTNEKT